MADTYSVVDKSKKIKNRSLPERKIADQETSNIGMYAVLEQRNFDQEQPNLSTLGTITNALYDMPSSSTPEAADSTAPIASKNPKENRNSDCKLSTKLAFCVLALAIALVVFALVSFICLAVLFVEINKLKSSTPSNMQQQTSPNETANIQLSQLADQLSQFNISFSAFKQSVPGQITQQFTLIESNITNLNSENQRLSYSYTITAC